MRKVILVALLAVTVVPAFAYFVDGNDLVEWRNAYRQTNSGSSKDYYESARYMGQVMSVVDIMLLAEMIELPPRSTVGQLCAMVGVWLDKHPDRWTEPAVALIRDALIDAFGVD